MQNMKASRDRDGLIEPVKTTRMKVTKHADRIERPASSGRMLEQLITYSSDGQKIEEITYGEDGATHSRKVYLYDEAEHPGWVIFDSGGSLLQRFVCIHGPDEKRAEHFLYGGDGQLQERRIRYYDKDSKQCEETYYTADGTLMRKWATIYDDQATREHRTVI